MVKNPPANKGDVRLIPGHRISHMLQVDPRTHPRSHALQQEKPLQREACVPQLEKDWAQQ